MTMNEVNPANTVINDEYTTLCELMDTAHEVKDGLNAAMIERSEQALQKKMEEYRIERDKSLSDAERGRGGGV